MDEHKVNVRRLDLEGCGSNVRYQDLPDAVRRADVRMPHLPEWAQCDLCWGWQVFSSRVRQVELFWPFYQHKALLQRKLKKWSNRIVLSAGSFHLCNQVGQTWGQSGAVCSAYPLVLMTFPDLPFLRLYGTEDIKHINSDMNISSEKHIQILITWSRSILVSPLLFSL